MALPLDQVKVVDADTHFTEPHDLWTSRAPAALQGPGSPCHHGRRGAPPGWSTARSSAGPGPAGSSTGTA